MKKSDGSRSVVYEQTPSFKKEFFNSFDFFSRTHIPLLCPELISEESAEQILALASLFPACPSQSIYFEHLLNESNRYADFVFILDSQKHSWGSIRESLHASANPLIKKKHWKNFFDFLDQCEKHELYRDTFKKVWLCADLGPLVSQFEEFCFPDPTVYFSFLKKPSFELIEPIRKYFTQDQMSSTTRENLKRCYEECDPLNLRVRYFGLMCGRSLASVRLYIGEEALRENLEKYLLLIGYSYDIAPLLKVLKKIDPYLGYIGLGIDVGETIGDRIGIECFIPSNYSHSKSKLQWKSILSLLCSLGMLSEKKKNILLNWQGAKRVREGESTLLFLRTINYVKLVFDKSGKVDAKVYLMAHKL